MPKLTRDILVDMYIDYVNNFISTAYFAGYYGLSHNKAFQALRIGKKIYEKRVSVK